MNQDNAAAPDLGWLKDKRSAIRDDADLQSFAQELETIVDEFYNAGQGGLLLSQLHLIAGEARRDLIELGLDAEYQSQARVSAVGAAEEQASELSQLQSDTQTAKVTLDKAPDVQALRRALVEAESVRLRGLTLLPDSGHWGL